MKHQAPRLEISSSNARMTARWPASVWITVVVVCLCYAGFTWSSSLYFASAQAGRHYDFLTEGFMRGHTYLSIEPHPGLATLANPYAGAQGIPRLHDSTYYHGKYYLYFGVSPVLVLLAPWRLLTGTHLADVATVGVFSLVGTLLGISIWLGIIRRFFASLRVCWINLGILTLGFGGYITANMERAEFYQIAISCAYCCLMGGLWFLFCAVSSQRVARRTTFLGLASFCWALAVGARPNYIFGLSALGIATLMFFFLNWKRRGFANWETWRFLLWGVLPAAVVGVGLMTYNFVRFGNVAEFGQKYQLAAEDFRSTQMIGLGSVIPNIKDYFLNPCYYSRYFPFVELPGPTFGTVFWAPFAMLGFLLPVLFIWRRWRGDMLFRIFGITVYLTALMQVSGLLLFAFTHNRYLVDFLPTLTLLGLFVLAAVFSSAIHRTARLLAGAAFSVLSLFTISHALLLTIERCPDDRLFTPLAKALNCPVYLWDKLNHVSAGPMVGEVVFSPADAGVREPLLAASHGRDVLFVEHRPEGKIRFGFFHLGTISPYSAEIPIEYGKIYRVRMDLGAMYPSRDYPSLWGYSRSAAESLHRRVEVSIDDRIVYHVSSDFYASDPTAIAVGENLLRIGTVPTFNGHFAKLHHVGVPSAPELIGQIGTGPVKLSVMFPNFPAVVGEPLVSTGERGKGDVIFVTYLASGRAKFGHDSARFGSVESRPVDFDPSQEHSIEIDAPSLYGETRNDTSGYVRIKFDGKLLISTQRTFAASSPIDVVFGYNAVTSSACGAMFTGPKLEAERIPAFVTPLTPARSWGPLRMTVVFPQGMITAQEPLVVTGKPGAGDFVYVRYLSSTEIQIGYDHWAIGGFLSDPIKIDFRTTNQVEVSFGGLYPSVGDEWWTQNKFPPKARDVVIVRVNDVIVLNRPYPAHPSSRDSITIGQNSIGGSTCRPTFTGEIQAIESIAVPAELN